MAERADYWNLIRDEIAKSPLGDSRFSIPGTLVKVTWAARDPSDPTAGREPTEVEYPCRVRPARVTGTRGSGEARTNQKDKNAKFNITGGSLPIDVVPEPGDYLEVDGVRWRISGDVTGTDARASFAVTCRLA